MNQKKQAILAAARAEMIPAGTCGLWTVRKFSLGKPFPKRTQYEGKWRDHWLPEGSYTQLFRMTLGTDMHGLPGELVMQDTPEELNTHLEFMLKAHGRVLITGLGLGCVARGCLANPDVEHVTVIERDRNVMRLVAPFMPKDRLKIMVADALTWTKRNRKRFTCAWHDLWSDPDKDESNLQVNHLAMMIDLRSRVDFQGAWQFPRKYRKRTWNVI